MANSSCSHWWHAPIYLAMSLTLAFISITFSTHSQQGNPTPSSHLLALNASRALHRHGGFNAIAAMLQVFPDLLISYPETTVFAIQDSAIANLSIPPSAMRQLLRYHIVPSHFPISEITKKPPGSCLKTLLPNKNLIITATGNGSSTINGVLISEPNLFIEGLFSVHGVPVPFDVNLSSSCNYSSSTTDKIEWPIINRILSTHGYVSFAIGLNSILDVILENHRNLSSVTVFAPPNSGFISSPSLFLEKIVGIHIVDRKFTYSDLWDSGESSLKTVIHGYHLKIERFSEYLTINGVEISKADMFLSKKFAIHGISRAFDSVDYSTSSNRDF